MQFDFEGLSKAVKLTEALSKGKVGDSIGVGIDGFEERDSPCKLLKDRLMKALGQLGDLEGLYIYALPEGGEVYCATVGESIYDLFKLQYVDQSGHYPVTLSFHEHGDSFSECETDIRDRQGLDRAIDRVLAEKDLRAKILTDTPKKVEKGSLGEGSPSEAAAGVLCGLVKTIDLLRACYEASPYENVDAYFLVSKKSGSHDFLKCKVAEVFYLKKRGEFPVHLFLYGDDDESFSAAIMEVCDSYDLTVALADFMVQDSTAQSCMSRLGYSREELDRG